MEDSIGLKKSYKVTGIFCENEEMVKKCHQGVDFLICTILYSIRFYFQDFEGQKKAERTFQVIIIVFAVSGVY